MKSWQLANAGDIRAAPCRPGAGWSGRRRATVGLGYVAANGDRDQVFALFADEFAARKEFAQVFANASFDDLTKAMMVLLNLHSEGCLNAEMARFPFAGKSTRTNWLV